jgi:hypothetical protein
MLNNKKVYNEGETVTYLANSLHEPACEIDSEYDVIFKKVKNGVIRKYKTFSMQNTKDALCMETAQARKRF